MNIAAYIVYKSDRDKCAYTNRLYICDVCIYA